VVLLDADEHDESASGPAGRPRSKAEYLRDAARFGVWKKHERLLVPSAEVRSIRRLGDVAQ
jgi:hypothetical protein